MWCCTTLLVVLTLVSKVSVRGYDATYKVTLQMENEDSPEPQPYVATVSDEEYVRHIHSMYEALGGRTVVMAQVDTKYRTWKRNADLINSLLALPKDMNDAGR